MSTQDWVRLVTIPFFTGAIGWLINWTGLIMLFNPVAFHGLRVPGLLELSTLLPRKLQEVPGIMPTKVESCGSSCSRAPSPQSMSAPEGRWA